jgi:hypothetical protein
MTTLSHDEYQQAIQQLTLQSQVIMQTQMQMQLHFQQTLQQIYMQRSALILKKQFLSEEREEVEVEVEVVEANWRQNSHKHFRKLIESQIVKIVDEPDINKYLNHFKPTDKPKLVAAIEKRLYEEASCLADYIEFYTLKNRVLGAVKRLKRRCVVNRL